MEIELLYFDNCSSWQTALNNLKVALTELGIAAHIRIDKVTDDRQAESLKFLGSPSIRVRGVDLWPEEREIYAMGCRIYSTLAGLKGWPTVEMFKEKLERLP